MPDPADIANDLIELQILNTLRARTDAQVKMGPQECHECGEDIPLPRRELGFNLCVGCAQEAERHKALFSGE